MPGKIKFYPKDCGENRWFTEEEIKRGLIWLYADVTCESCLKEQSVAQANGFCIRCGDKVGP